MSQMGDIEFLRCRWRPNTEEKLIFLDSRHVCPSGGGREPKHNSDDAMEAMIHF